MPAKPASIRMAPSTRSTIPTTRASFASPGTNLDKINRIKIDLKTGEVEQMYAQQAT